MGSVKQLDNGLEPRHSLQPPDHGLESQQPDVAAGISARCNHISCDALAVGMYMVVAAYDPSPERTASRVCQEVGYLACLKGELIAVVDGTPQPGHEGNQWPWYVWGCNSQSVSGWLPAGILVPSTHLADDDNDDEEGCGCGGDDQEEDWEVALATLNLQNLD